MEPLRIYLFGGFMLERNGVSLPPIASRVGRSLFAHLVMNRDRSLQRDLLAGTFWPDLPESRARRRLSHTLWQVQDVVNTSANSHLEVTTDTLAFDTSSPYWLDVEEFDANFARPELDQGDKRALEAMEAARLRSCVELYRGDLLAGYFDDWVLVEQDHYRQRYLTALSRLVDVTKSSGSYEEALSYARRLTHHDPLSEEAHREVMRLCFLLGRTTDALEQYERCRSVLEEELGTRPSAPTIEIYQKILKQRRAGVRPLREEERAVLQGRRSDAPFVGREDERRLIVDSLEHVLAGSGGVVLVEGEPGVGKTRLTLEAAEDARWRGFEVSWGSCTSGALRPFAPLIEVLESLSPLRVEQLSEQVAPVWLGEMARLVPALGRRLESEAPAQLRPAEESTRMIEALVHTLGALGRIAPHLIIVDDVHWADRDTLAVLTQIGARLADSAVMLMLLYRSEEARGDAEVWDVLRDLDRLSGLGRVVLSPLSVFELEEMVRRILGVTRIDPAVAAHLHRQTGGNVLFTLETLLAIRDRGLFEGGADPVGVLEGQIINEKVPLAPRVRTVIESRMSLLGDEGAALYEMAAVAGDRIDLALLESATDMPRAAILSAMDELLYRGLIRDDGEGRYRIAHDQVRQVVYDSIATRRRRQIHLGMATALLDTEPENVEAIGHHFRESGEQQQAAVFLERAGLRALGINAFATAAHHLQDARMAAAKAALPDVSRYTLLGHLEDVYNVLGRRTEQRSVVEEMADIARNLPSLGGDLERRRAWLLAQTGDLARAESSAQRSVEFEQSSGDGAAAAASLVALGTVRRWSGRPLDAVPSLEEAVSAVGDGSARADALTELASTLVEVQRPETALEHLAEAGEIYRQLDDLRGLAEAAGIEARAHHQMGNRDQAAARYVDAIELCRRIGYRHGEAVNLTNLSNLHQLLGSVADALQGYDRAARLFDELGNRRGEAMVLANSASARHHLLGEEERARSDAIRAMQHFAEIGDHAREAQCQEVLAGVASRAGRREEARSLLEESLGQLAETGNVLLEGQHLRSLALFHLDEGDITSAHRVLDRAERLTRESALDELEIDLLSVRGLAHLAAGYPERAVAVTAAAVERLTTGVERAYLIHHRHALAAEAAGRLTEARMAGEQANAELRATLDGLDAKQLRRSLDTVPEHRAIVAAAERHSPQTIAVELPLADAPTGKTLDRHQLRKVVWTVDHPDDRLIDSPMERRRARLARLLEEAAREGAAPAAEHLAEALAVSPSTVRRDLRALRDLGKQAITRGKRRKVS